MAGETWLDHDWIDPCVLALTMDRRDIEEEPARGQGPTVPIFMKPSEPPSILKSQMPGFIGF